MRRRTAIALTALLTAALAGPVSAQTTYDDGGTHTINGASGPIILKGNGTTLNVEAPAVITGTNGHEAVNAAAGTAVNMIGGALQGALNDNSNNGLGGVGLVSYGSFSGTGGTIQGGSYEAYSTSLGAAGAVFLNSTNISGGTFLGGSSGSSVEGGQGAVFSSRSSTINGGAFVGGAGGLGGDGAQFNVFEASGKPLSLEINGGVFQGGDSPGGIHGVGLRIDLVGQSSAAISGGQFIGASDDSTPLSSLVVASSQPIGVPSAPAQLNITGGQFDGDIDLSMFNTNVNFFGDNFQYDPSTGEFRGTLLSGDLIDTKIEASYQNVRYIDSGNGEVTFAALPVIPEPSSIVMLALGAVGVGMAEAARRRGRRDGAAPGPPETSEVTV